MLFYLASSYVLYRKRFKRMNQNYHHPNQKIYQLMIP